MSNRILIITDQAGDVKELTDTLVRVKDGAFEIECANTLSAAMERLRSPGIDAILVNLSLPDSEGIATFVRLFATAPGTPMITLCAEDDDALAIEAVKRGAQGALSRKNFKSSLVPQSIGNIIFRKSVEELAFIGKARAEVTLRSISDAVITTDMAANVDYLNPAAEDMTGWLNEHAQGHSITEVMHIINGQTRLRQQNPIELVLQEGKPMELAAGTMLIRPDGREVAIEDSASPIFDSSGKSKGAVIVFHDITAAQALAERMAFLAHHDALTGLPNRVLMKDRIEQAISLANRSKTALAVLFLDLDGFKRINDSLGHETGDEVLRATAQRLLGCVRSSDTVGRYGGDEFVVLMALKRNAGDAGLTAKKLLTALAVPHGIAGQDLHVTASIGISIYPADAEDSEALLMKADAAMYKAKEKEPSTYQFFREEMNLYAAEQQVVETDLRLALQRGELKLYYQPKINLATGAITGCEALVRWNHPTRGMVMPADFMQIAERRGLILPLGEWVCQEACAQAQRWQAAHLETGTIAVNVSALQFRHADFVAYIRGVLEKTGLAPQLLQLEITETALMREADGNTKLLQALRSLGVQIAVDDFGSGYSSLSYLTRLPIDVLKIDQSFVQTIGSSRDDAIVSAIIAMGAGLGKCVIAEGVETQTQLDFLKARNCEEAQGFLLGRPVVAEEFAAMFALGQSDMVALQ